MARKVVLMAVVGGVHDCGGSSHLVNMATLPETDMTSSHLKNGCLGDICLSF